jgi:hypothetical protein
MARQTTVFAEIAFPQVARAREPPADFAVRVEKHGIRSQKISR